MKKHANAADAKRIFINHFEGILVPVKSHDDRGENHIEDFECPPFSNDPDRHMDLEERVILFAVEFMKVFKLGVIKRGKNFHIKKTGAVGRPLSLKGRKLVDILVPHEPHAKEDSGEPKPFSGICPNCDSNTVHTPLNQGMTKCGSCEEVIRTELFK